MKYNFLRLYNFVNKDTGHTFICMFTHPHAFSCLEEYWYQIEKDKFRIH